MRKKKKLERKKITGWSSSLSANLSCLFGLDDLGNTVVHFLDSLEFSQTHAAFVGDVINASLSFGVFTACSANLQVVFAGNFFKTSVVGSQFWNLDVN